MKLKNMVNVEYTKVLPDGTTTILQKQSNNVFTIIIPRKKKVKVINTYNFPPDPPPQNTNYFSIWDLILIMLIRQNLTQD